MNVKTSTPARDDRGHRLLQLGVLLFLLGLVIGFLIPLFKNPRMGLSSHLEGILNGIFLIVTGLLWSKLQLRSTLSTTLFWTLVFGAFANVTATFLAAVWGAGLKMTIAAEGYAGTTGQEMIIDVLLISLSLAMVVASILLLLGLRRPSAERSRANHSAP